MKEKYLSLMELALSAYTEEHISDFFDKVRREGFKNHGFPRLTANIGILVANGRRRDLLPKLIEMMDFCCETIPHTPRGNNFSVREIISAIKELERSRVVDEQRINQWKEALSGDTVRLTYTPVAHTPDTVIYNWTLFAAVSEWERQNCGLCDSSEFIETQLATQVMLIDNNGMYHDPHNPTVYDLVSRGLFAGLLHSGYRGKYYEEIDRALKTAGLITLDMQSVTGEIPFGGRSNGFLFNEPLLAIVCEYEANRYYREGNIELAGKFKAAIASAMDYTERMLKMNPITHIKNRFPREKLFACEPYGDFEKYMISTASYIYSAYQICDDSIPSGKRDTSPMTQMKAARDFGKLFMRAGGYFLEFDIDSNPSYDSNGLGRLHKEGAPSEICLSCPATATPNYNIYSSDAVNASLCVGYRTKDEIRFDVDTHAQYEGTSLYTGKDFAKANFIIGIDGKKVKADYTVDSEGVIVNISLPSEQVLYMLPVLSFDGEMKTDVTVGDSSIEIRYRGWVCKYTTDGEIKSLDREARNRNGIYSVYCATGMGALRVKIEITRE